jgi:phosphoglycolate phosphatase-like HAD superfamily hydrolase
MVVSGGAQDELRSLLEERGIAHWFDRGIYGSPTDKDEILSYVSRSGRLIRPGLFFGDSRYDHEAARRAGLDFVFVAGWSEFADWRSYCAEHSIQCIDSLAEAPAVLEISARPDATPE